LHSYVTGAADDLGLGDMVEAAANIKDSTSTGSGTGGPPKVGWLMMCATTFLFLLDDSHR
jgi:hypothetical protein